MRDPIRIGVLGTARINRRIVADLQSIAGLQVTAIASREAGRAAWSASQLGIGDAVEGYAALIDRDDIDAVYIPLPPALHSQWALATLDSNKHVLVEKPLCQRVENAEEIAARARERNCVWLDATAWLHHPRTKHMDELIQARLGGVRHVSVACSFFKPFQEADHRLQPELGGGCLLDLGWYAAGLIAWVMDADPVAVQAIGEYEENLPMRVSALLKYPDHRSATFNCGYDIATRKWFEVAGEQASLICDDFTRPWPDRPARFWVHDRAGAVAQHTVEGLQEQHMAITFRDAIRGHVDIGKLQAQALRTQRLLAAVDRVSATADIPG